MLIALAILAAAPQFVTSGDVISTSAGDDIYIKAVNLGSALPGHFPNEHAIDEATYRGWFKQMSAAGFNAVRVFDRQAPQMYRALAAHNRERTTPLYLLQGVWLPDAEANDLYSSSKAFDSSIVRAVDAVHGAGNHERAGKSEGYTADVSRWVLGWIIGRELEPVVVETTNKRHPRKTALKGRYVALERGNATERWIAARFERLAGYEMARFGQTRPMAFVSWPPLDPLHHESATHRTSAGQRAGLDDVSVDTSRIHSRAGAAGIFEAYSVYPYYPAFIASEPEHQLARDDKGVNPYLGYLERLKRHYKNRPLLVAEYGVPTSKAVATREPVTGMHFGGLDESAQADALVRMTTSIAAAGCAGGVVFSWMDEWWKPTWIVRKLTDVERSPLWHDLVSPEEHFGLVAFVAEQAVPDTRVASKGRGRLREIHAAARHDGLRVRVVLGKPLSSVELLTLELDTIDRPRKGKSEFKLEVSEGVARLLVAASYRDPAREDGWVSWTWQTSEASRDDQGTLRAATNEVVGRLELESSDDAIVVVIPWTLLRFSDPSQRLAHGQKPGSTVTSTGIQITAALLDDSLRGQRLSWTPWSQAPETTERAKPALAALAATLVQLP